MAGDPQSRFSYPSGAHLCHAAKPAPIDLAYQTQYCLSGRYESCSRFQRAEVGASRASKRQRSARPLRLWAALIVVSVIALASSALAIAFATGILAPLTGDPRIATATVFAVPPTVEPVAQPTVVPASPTPAPTVTPTATASATARPSATPGPTVTPLASPLIHVVQRGETLRSIAALYGLTVAELAEANGIEDPNRIRIGLRLVIPGVQPSPTP